MPIRRYVGEGVFTPKAISEMSKALADTAEILGIGSDEKGRETIAQFLIRLAREDASLNAAALRDRAVAALGGEAFRNAHSIQQPTMPTRTLADR
jgi:hypothetical protein